MSDTELSSLPVALEDPVSAYLENWALIQKDPRARLGWPVTYFDFMGRLRNLKCHFAKNRQFLENSMGHINDSTLRTKIKMFLQDTSSFCDVMALFLMADPHGILSIKDMTESILCLADFSAINKTNHGITVVKEVIDGSDLENVNSMTRIAGLNLIGDNKIENTRLLMVVQIMFYIKDRS